MTNSIPDYGYGAPEDTWESCYVTQPALATVRRHVAAGARVFELGCGNGFFAAKLHRAGYEVVAVDPSASGISQARAAHPGITFAQASAEANLCDRFGQFAAVVSLEVLEHCYAPREAAAAMFGLLAPGGCLVLSTPYHGYWKNLALAITGRLERHLNPLWEGGHIKFFSIGTLRALLANVGFTDIRFMRVGRWPRAFAKSMIAIARRP